MTQRDTTADETDVEIDDRLGDDGWAGQVIVQFADPDLDGASNRDACIDRLQRSMDDSRASIDRFVTEREGIAIEQEFWITNAVLVDIDTSEVSLEDLAATPDVEVIHPNEEVATVEDDSKTGDEPAAQLTSSGTTAGPTESVEPTSEYDTTYGVEMIRAPAVWDEFDTRGDGATVAVLSTGVDIDHPDIDLYTEDADDPTYPGGWAEFDDDGNELDTEPNDMDGFGTQLTGIVSGGDASGTYIGVAQAVRQLHGKVFDDGGGATFAQVIGGLEWAVDEGADVVCVGLNADGYWEHFIEPVRNSAAAGTLVVGTSGMDGEGTSGSPGNVYESTAVGAVNEDETVADDSSGEEIDTDEAWDDPPDDWPDSYIVPDVTAPGIDTFTADLEGEYTEVEAGTQAAYVAGALGLMLAASDDATNEELRDSLYVTATKPVDDSDERDTRYGLGIIDVKSATNPFALDSGVEGTVTDETDTPLEEAIVAGEISQTTTDEEGWYSLLEPEGEVEVTAEAFGYVTESHEVVVPDDEFVQEDFSLAATADATQLTIQPAGIEGGEAFDVEFEVIHVDQVTVEMAGDYDVADASLEINGTTVEFGTVYALEEGTDTVELEVTTTSDTAGDISLEVTFEGEGSPVSRTTGPTDVYQTFVHVGVIDDEGEYGVAVEAALKDVLPAYYTFSQADQSVLTDLDTFDVLVVQTLPDEEDFVQDFIDDTAAADVGTIFLDQFSGDSNGVTRLEAHTNLIDSLNSEWDDDEAQFFIQDDHYLFTDVGGADDIVPVLTDGFDHADRAWFDSQEFDVLATVGADGAVDGPAIAVDTETDRIILSAHGRTSFTEENFTTAADTILANAVTYLSAVLSINIDGATISQAGEASIDIAAGAHETVIVRGLWTDWDITVADDAGSTVEDDVDTAGRMVFDWDGEVENPVLLSLSITPPTRYVGGAYLLAATANAGEESVETTGLLEIE